MKRVAANRRVGIGDPDFVEVPTEKMISREVAKFIANDIDLEGSRDVKTISPLDVSPFESSETTHYSVADSQGNVVATTYTLGYSFGSGLVIPGTGILLDNQIRNFSHRVPDHANAMQGGKRMVSTMAPTIVFTSNGSPFLVTGSPGGSRIPNIVTQMIVNTTQYGLNVAQATHAPRIHQQWRTPNLGYEAGHSVDTLKLLESKGHTVEQQQTMGSTQSILMKDGFFYGSADPRRPGAAALGVD
jgi:gamma-glutamyltranspeptidase/glutathione hydrolase